MTFSNPFSRPEESQALLPSDSALIVRSQADPEGTRPGLSTSRRALSSFGSRSISHSNIGSSTSPLPASLPQMPRSHSSSSLSSTWADALAPDTTAALQTTSTRRPIRKGSSSSSHLSQGFGFRSQLLNIGSTTSSLPASLPELPPLRSSSSLSSTRDGALASGTAAAFQSTSTISSSARAADGASDVVRTARQISNLAENITAEFDIVWTREEQSSGNWPTKKLGDATRKALAASAQAIHSCLLEVCIFYIICVYFFIVLCCCYIQMSNKNRDAGSIQERLLQQQAEQIQYLQSEVSDLKAKLQSRGLHGSSPEDALQSNTKSVPRKRLSTTSGAEYSFVYL